MKRRKYQQAPPPAPPDRIAEDLFARAAVAFNARRESQDEEVRAAEFAKLESAVNLLLRWAKDGIVPGQ